jgi:hypothetical protein
VSLSFITLHFYASILFFIKICPSPRRANASKSFTRAHSFPLSILYPNPLTKDNLSFLPQHRQQNPNNERSNETLGRTCSPSSLLVSSPILVSYQLPLPFSHIRTTNQTPGPLSPNNSPLRRLPTQSVSAAVQSRLYTRVHSGVEGKGFGGLR